MDEWARFILEQAKLSADLEKQAQKSKQEAMRASLIQTLDSQILAKSHFQQQAKSTALLFDKENLNLTNELIKDQQREQKQHRAQVIKVGKHQLQTAKESQHKRQ